MEDKLARLYSELEREIAASSLRCEACGRCCDFDAADHQLWLTNWELEHLLTLARADLAAAPGAKCPFLRGSECTARKGRALGCRTYFCRDPRGKGRELHERYLGVIRQMARERGLELRYDELLASLAQSAKRSAPA